MEVRGREGAIVDREIGQEFRTTQSLAVVGYLLIVKGRVSRYAMAGPLLDTFSEKQEKRPRQFSFTRQVIERLLEISQNSSGKMQNASRKILLILLVGELSFGLSVAQAGPLDFFRRIRDSIAHPRHHQGTVTKTQSKGDNGTTVKRNDVRPPELKEPETTETPEPASSVPAQRTRTDLPYGVPVPNKPGFVISPYSRNAGYVDIRGFPTGAEVKDPFTGKVFITP